MTVKGSTTQGSFDKARFTVNGDLRTEVTQKRPGTDEFFDEFVLPANIETFNVTAEVHHVEFDRWL